MKYISFGAFVALINLTTVIFTPAVTEAKVTLSSYSNYFYKVNDTDPTNIILYAGATNTACSSASSDSPCDSCAGLVLATGSGDLAHCNSNQIHSTLQFTVTIRADSVPSGTALMKMSVAASGGGSGGTVEPVTPRTVVANQDVSASFRWTDICAKASPDGTCARSFKAQVSVGIDTGSGVSDGQKFTISYRYVSQAGAFQTLGCNGATTYEGFCDFYVYPGDEKVFVDSQVNNASSYTVEDLSNGDSGAADASGQTFAALRVYYRDGNDFQQISPASSYTDLVFDASSGTFKTNKVTGLNNDVQYVFLTASVDQGGNVMYFVDPAAATAGSTAPVCPSDGANLCNDSSPAYYGDGRSKTQSGTPRQVLGLFDQTKCFIATAAFGSPMDEHVMMLRKFRDQILIHNPVGALFTKYYYKWSPDVAAVIAQHESLRWGSRQLLWPVIGIVYLVMNFGVLLTIVMLLTGATVLAGVVMLLRRRRIESTEASA